jgi:hypothetical protein
VPEFCGQAIHLISYRKVIYCTYYIANSIWWRHNLMDWCKQSKNEGLFRHDFEHKFLPYFQWHVAHTIFRLDTFYIDHSVAVTLSRSHWSCPVWGLQNDWLIDWLIGVLKDKWMFSSSLYVTSHGPIYLASHANSVMARFTAVSHNSITKFETVMIRESIFFCSYQILSNINTVLILTPKHVLDCTLKNCKSYCTNDHIAHLLISTYPSSAYVP